MGTQVIPHLLQGIAYGLMIVGYLFVSVKYFFQALIAWREKSRAETLFIKEMKENHLPHIYETLKALCFYQNIPYQEPK